MHLHVPERSGTPGTQGDCLHAPLPHPALARIEERRTMHTPIFALVPLALCIAAGCASNQSASSAPDVPAGATGASGYAALWSEFLSEYLRREPVDATALGNHDHDGAWPDLSSQGRADAQGAYDRIGQRLAVILASGLGARDRLDAEILANKIETLSFHAREMRSEENDPRAYTELLGAGLDPFVSREYAPASVRATSLAARLSGIGAVVGVARARLGHPPRIMTETAIRQTKGLIGLVDGGFPELLKEAHEKRTEVLAAAALGSKALHDLLSFLEGELLARSDGDFRVGREKLKKILELTLDRDVDPDELVVRARSVLAKTQDDMESTARELWHDVMGGAPLPDASTPAAKRALVRQVLDRLAEDHSTNASIIGDATKVLADATDFVRLHDLVGLPTQPCKVMELPEYRRGVAIAYCDWAGPLETKAETHVSISPVPADWPAARAASFYREYDRSMLADLMVHEAMPGHFLQGAHAAEFHAVPRAVFANDAFVEGWAVYAEWLMAKHGFGGPRVRLQRQKMLARVAANTILDHEIHAGSMDEKAALELMENEAFQEEGEAVGKWTRARVSHGQLSQYLYGFTELMKLREVAEKQPGFSERAFHDKLLSFGAPSVHQLRAQMGL
jgi:hypothetical protein